MSERSMPSIRGGSKHVAGIICRIKTCCGPDSKNSLETRCCLWAGGSLMQYWSERAFRTHFKKLAAYLWLSGKRDLGLVPRIAIGYDCWMASKRLTLSPRERRRHLRSRSVRSEDARRADCHLEECARAERARDRGFWVQPSYLQRWTNQFRQTRLSGLVAQHRGRKARANAAAPAAKVLEGTRRGPADRSTHSSGRCLARNWASGT